MTDPNPEATETTISAPVTFTIDPDDRVTLTFGPMPFDDLLDTLVNLGTEEGQANFLTHLDGAIKAATNNMAKEMQGE